MKRSGYWEGILLLVGVCGGTISRWNELHGKGEGGRVIQAWEMEHWR